MIDAYLNRFTMYRLMLYCLFGLVGVAIAFAWLGELPFSPLGLLTSAVLLAVTCLSINWLLARLFRAIVTPESPIITGLILFCVFAPPRTLTEAGRLAAIGAIAMASKYVLAYRRRHIFNPAAFAAMTGGLLGLAPATWWIATDVMALFVGLFGIAIVRKLHRGLMVQSFMIAAAGLVLLDGLQSGLTLPTVLTEIILSWPIIFLGTIMLTDPLTTPPRHWQQMVYGSLVGGLSISGLHIAGLTFTPEMAVVAGNAFMYSTMLHARLALKLTQRRNLGGGIYEYRFAASQKFHRLAGQYLDLNLPLEHPDARGNRRSFSIASSPTEPDILFGIKHSTPGSAFKQALLNLPENGQAYGALLGGDFVLPSDTTKKLLLIAGGIGVTPFRSMLQYVIDTKQQRDIVLIYVASDVEQFVYQDIFTAAAATGLRLVRVLSPPDPAAIPADWHEETGRITPDLLKRIVPDITHRYVYVSGPNAMVIATKHMLRQMGVRRTHIKVDYFAGY